MSGGFEKIQRKSCSLAIFSSPEPGSVIAANCLPAPPPGFAGDLPTSGEDFMTCSQKYAKCERVSVVSPDFEATMKRELWILIFDRTPRMVAGSVVSRTCSFGWPLTAPNVLRRTSGHRLEPPIPSRTTSE